MVLRNGAVRLARPAPRAALGFVDSVDRAAHADDLESFVLRKIASHRAIRHIGLGTHHAGGQAFERSGGHRPHRARYLACNRWRANQNQSCQHLTLLHHRLMDLSFFRARPRNTNRLLSPQAATSSASSPQADRPKSCHNKFGRLRSGCRTLVRALRAKMTKMPKIRVPACFTVLKRNFRRVARLIRRGRVRESQGTKTEPLPLRQALRQRRSPTGMKYVDA